LLFLQTVLTLDGSSFFLYGCQSWFGGLREWADVHEGAEEAGWGDRDGQVGGGEDREDEDGLGKHVDGCVKGIVVEGVVERLGRELRCRIDAWCIKDL
jgi:hypothetical protein